MYLHNLIAGTFNKFAPIQELNVRMNKNNYKLSDETKHLIRRKKSCARLYKKHKDGYHKQEFRAVSKQVKLSIKKDTKLHVQRSIMEKGVWNTINSFFNLSFKK